MASPIGHVLAGQLAYRGGSAATSRTGAALAWLCAFAAIAPDLDFLPGIVLGHPALYHQGASHSLAAAAVFTFVLALAYARRWRGLVAVWTPLFLAYASHLLLDLFGPDKRPPYGIPLLWPFSDRAYLSPLQIFLGFHHAGSTGASVHQWISGILSPRNLAALATELVVLVPPVVVTEIWVRRRGRFASAAGADRSRD